MTAPVTDALMGLALEMAQAARDIVLAHYANPPAFEDKADMSPVTAADRAVEVRLRQMIADAFPDHGVYGEEMGADRADAEYVWVLDPIDGTKAFISGKPLFGSLIGLLHEGRPALGVVEMAALGETWAGAQGYAATRNGAPVSPRTCPDLARAWLHSTSPQMHTGLDFDRFERLRHACLHTLYGADCYNYAMLAAGRADLVCESSLAPYDYVAPAALVEAAGGRATDWTGRPLSLESDGRVLASGDPAAHEKALDILGA